MDLVLKLREIRRLKGLSQKDAARLSGVGEKTISSFETGERVGAMKLCQLKRLLAVYEMSEAEFFGGGVEKQIAPWELDPEQFATARLIDEIGIACFSPKPSIMTRRGPPRESLPNTMFHACMSPTMTLASSRPSRNTSSAALRSGVKPLRS